MSKLYPYLVKLAEDLVEKNQANAQIKDRIVSVFVKQTNSIKKTWETDGVDDEDHHREIALHTALESPSLWKAFSVMRPHNALRLFDVRIIAVLNSDVSKSEKLFELLSEFRSFDSLESDLHSTIEYLIENRQVLATEGLSSVQFDGPENLQLLVCANLPQSDIDSLAKNWAKASSKHPLAKLLLTVDWSKIRPKFLEFKILTLRALAEAKTSTEFLQSIPKLVKEAGLDGESIQQLQQLGSPYFAGTPIKYKRMNLVDSPKRLFEFSYHYFKKRDFQIMEKWAIHFNPHIKSLKEQAHRDSRPFESVFFYLCEQGEQEKIKEALHEVDRLQDIAEQNKVEYFSKLQTIIDNITSLPGLFQSVFLKTAETKWEGLDLNARIIARSRIEKLISVGFRHNLEGMELQITSTQPVWKLTASVNRIVEQLLQDYLLAGIGLRKSDLIEEGSGKEADVGGRLKQTAKKNGIKPDDIAIFDDTIARWKLSIPYDQ